MLPLSKEAYFILVVSLLTLYRTNCQNVDIIRGEKDVFTNIAKDDCSSSKADCFNKNCTYCQCRGETFIQARGKYGECVENEYLAYVTCEWFDVYDRKLVTVINFCMFACDSNYLSKHYSNFNIHERYYKYFAKPVVCVHNHDSVIQCPNFPPPRFIDKACRIENDLILVLVKVCFLYNAPSQYSIYLYV